MKKARYLVALSCACACVSASAGCGTEVATAVLPAAQDSGTPGLPPPQCTSTKLADRLIRNTIPLSENIRYKRTGYYFGLPQDDRIAFSVLNDHVGWVAWVDSGGSTVHVTPLTITPDSISLFGTDVPVQGTELSGLVALDDGFALLTRRTDPGEPLGEAMTALQATYLVRWKDRSEVFRVPLTGTTSIVSAPDNQKRDFPNPVSGYFNSLSGRLAFNGTHFAAYFSVRGAAGDLYENSHGDKFVQVDKNGQFVSGWRMGCRTSLGNRLVAEPNGFLAFCMSNGDLGDPGPQLVIKPGQTTRLAPENATDAYNGNFIDYAGGNFGSTLATSSGYLVAWASRGVDLGTGNEPNPPAGHNSHEPAVAILDHERNVLPVRLRWPFLLDNATKPTRAAVNVHAGVYGDKVLLVWESIESPQFRSSLGYSTGTYGGTHFRLVDTAGVSASDEEIFVNEAIAPNGQDDIVRFPNGDLGWAYVPETRDFQNVLTPAALPNLPAISEIKFVRVRYCTP